MTTNIIRFLNITTAGLLAGIIFGIWLGFDPGTFSFTTYLEHQQAAINALNVLMPVLGLITIILTLVSAFRQKNSKGAFFTLLLAAVLLMITGLVTKFGNQPINTIVMTWTHADVPSDWTELRDRWWTLHKIRSCFSVFAFMLIVWTSSKKN